MERRNTARLMTLIAGASLIPVTLHGYDYTKNGISYAIKRKAHNSIQPGRSPKHMQHKRVAMKKRAVRRAKRLGHY